MSIDSTISLDEASSKQWDVIVIGAGPAGSMAAIQLRKVGASVLLVDKAEHPREKICGCCLNGEAVELLDSIEFAEHIRALNAVPTIAISLHSGKHGATLKLKAGMVVSRPVLDSELIKRCIDDGAHYLSLTKATVGSSVSPVGRAVQLEAGGECRYAQARCVLVADGLSGHSLDPSQLLPAKSREHSRIGAGVRVTDYPVGLFEPGVIYMTCGSGGYVGMVVLEDGSLDVAAAFDRGFVQSFKHVGEAANHVIANTNFAGLSLERSGWQGTPALTRKRSAFSAPCLFVIGDAASYAEPFTGEGMAWALLSAVSVAPIVQSLLASSSPAEFDHASWDRKHKELIAGKQIFSMALAQFLRSPRLIKLSTRILGLAPILAVPVIRAIGRDRSVKRRV